MSERDVKGIWIPIEIWEAEDLTWFQRLLLAEIDSLDRGEGCWKTDKALAERMDCSIGHLKNTLSQLRSRKWIKSRVKNGHRFLRARHSRWVSEKLPKGKRDVTSRVSETLPAHHHTTYDDTRIHTSSAPGRGLVAGVCFFDPEDTSPLSKAVIKFSEFTIERRWHIGRPGSTKSGWTRPVLLQWRKELSRLIEQCGDQKGVLKMLKWFMSKCNEPYLPRCFTLPAFCSKYSKVVDAYQRELKDHPEANGKVVRKLFDPGDGRGKVMVSEWVPN